MKDPLNFRKTKPSFDVNWKIREIFSESALSSLFRELDDQNNATGNNV